MKKFILQLEFKPQDMWIGLYWDMRGQDFHAWLCLLPMFPIHLVIREVK